VKTGPFLLLSKRLSSPNGLRLLVIDYESLTLIPALPLLQSINATDRNDLF